MSSSKFLVVFLSIVFHSLAIGKDLTKIERHQLAEKYFEKKFNTKKQNVLSVSDEMYFKNSVLYRGRNLSKQHSLIKMILITSSGSIYPISKDVSFDIFLKDIDPIIINEGLVLNNTELAILHMKKILNIFGIFEQELKCSLQFEIDKFKCHLLNTSPKNLELNLFINKTGSVRIIN